MGRPRHGELPTDRCPTCLALCAVIAKALNGRPGTPNPRLQRALVDYDAHNDTAHYHLAVVT